MRFAADKQELHSEGVGAHEVYSNEQKPQGEDRLLEIASAGDPDDGGGEDKYQGEAERGDVCGNLLHPLHELKCLEFVLLVYFGQAGEKRLGKAIERERLTGVGDPLRDGIESGDRIIGKQPQDKNTGRGVGVYRRDGDKNIPADPQLLP